MFKIFRIISCVTFLFLCVVQNTRAESSVSLPIGALVRYGGSECGQIQSTWVPGSITSKGKFTPSSSSLTDLEKQYKKAPKSKKKSILKKINSLKKQILTQSTICAQLGTGAIAPRSIQSASTGSQTIASNFDVRSLTISDIGSQFNYFCPANFQILTIYGSDTYTSDSPICTAAAHAGVILPQFGGNVTIKIKAGLDLYLGGIRNGVTSSPYPAFTLSYSFINSSNGNEVSSPAPTINPLSSNAALFRSRSGLPLTVICPANGTAYTIYGTGTYTDDSSVCTAAVHAGKISLLKGGQVTFVIAPGLTSYTASTKNKITSYGYGSWSGSYNFQ